MPEHKQSAYFARTNARRPFRAFGIKELDRFSHTYVIGKTGVGKTTLLETLISQDLIHGNGNPKRVFKIAARSSA